jgi:hypothetical protein
MSFKPIRHRGHVCRSASVELIRLRAEMETADPKRLEWMGRIVLRKTEEQADVWLADLRPKSSEAPAPDRVRDDPQS